MINTSTKMVMKQSSTTIVMALIYLWVVSVQVVGLLSSNLLGDVSAFAPQLTPFTARTPSHPSSSSSSLPQHLLFSSSSSSSSSPDPTPTGGVNGFGINGVNGVNGINGASTPSSSSSSSPDPSAATRMELESTTNDSDSEKMTSYFEMPGMASTSEASAVLNPPPQQQQQQEQQKNKLLSRLRSLSNFASFLCVLDCTLLPLVTVALPLLGVLQLPDAQLALLNELGHKLALYFVLPVGSMTGIINFSSHQKKWILSLAAVGIFLVAIANVHFHHLPAIASSILPSTITSTIETVLVAVQDCSGASAAAGTGIPWHRITNVAGCASLLSSNYLSQKQGCAYHDHDDHDDTCDGHNHSHDHGQGDHGDDCDHHDHDHD